MPNKCLKEFPFSMEDAPTTLEEYVNAKEDFQCYIKCTMEEINTFSNGEYRLENAKKRWENNPVTKNHIPQMEEIAKECVILKGTNECETAHLINVCLLKNFIKAIPDLQRVYGIH